MQLYPASRGYIFGFVSCVVWGYTEILPSFLKWKGLKCHLRVEAISFMNL